MRKVSHYIMTLFLANMLTFVVLAQNTTLITGQIVDSINNESIAGVTVTRNGTSVGTQTNSNGSFTISVPGLPAILKISAIGYVTKVVQVDTNNLPPVIVKLVPVGPVVVPIRGVKYKIGDSAFCGVVFYIEDNSSDSTTQQHYQRLLICSLNDQALHMRWHNGRYITTTATDDRLFGKQNADTIIFAQGIGSYAALAAKSIRINIDSTIKGCDFGDTSDWYLPSKQELIKLYKNYRDTSLNLKARLRFAKEGYWSSVELAVTGNSANKQATRAWIVDFLNGRDFPVNKANKYHVRAIKEVYNTYTVVTN